MLLVGHRFNAQSQGKMLSYQNYLMAGPWCLMAIYVKCLLRKSTSVIKGFLGAEKLRGCWLIVSLIS